ncbi:MAG: hypothetical protein OXL39_19335, partial [Caldilineaceae bacterium]|nr:hypothetical protein [Caldilineaceae bacterium]
MADSLFGLVAHPLAVVAHVVGQARRALPGGADADLAGTALGVDGGPAGKLGRNLDHGFVDEDGDGVEVAGVAFET